MQQQVMKRNIPSDFGLVSDGGWGQQNSSPGSGSWTSATNQDNMNSTWQSISKTDDTSDPADESSSGKSSTAASSSVNTSQSHDTSSTSTPGILSTNSSSLWSTSNPSLSIIDSSPWANSSSSVSSGINNGGWSSNSSMPMSNNLAQTSTNSNSASYGAVTSSVGWSAGGTVNNLSGSSSLLPNMNSGLQPGNMSSQFQSGSVLGNLNNFSKASDSGWNNSASSLFDGTKDLGGGSADSRVWGPSADKGVGSHWDTPKSQWGSSPSEQAAANVEMSFAQATLKGLNLPPAGNSQPVVDSRHEEILRAIESHDGWGSRPIRQDTSWEVEASPKAVRKFSSEGNAPAPNVWNSNNSNGTAIWEAVRENQNSQWGANSGNSWNPEKDNSSWMDPMKAPQDSNTWNVTTNADSKAFGTWGATGNSGDTTDKPWGQKTEIGSWCDNGGGIQRAVNISSWGDDGDTGAWEDQRRLTAMANNMQPIMPSNPGVNAPTGLAGITPQVVGNMASVGPDATSWNDLQKPGWSANSAPTVLRPTVDEPWNKPPPMRTGWGDAAHEGADIDNGTNIWASAAPKPVKPNWPEAAGPQGQWSSTIGAKPKMPGWDETSLALAQRAKMPQRVTGGGSHPPTQMRAKLLQHLMDMGFRKEDAQTALINNNLNLDMAISDLKAGTLGMPKKDLDVDNFSMSGSHSRLPFISKGGMGSDDLSDGRTDAPAFSNLPAFLPPQMPSQGFVHSGTNMTAAGLNIGSANMNTAVQQKVVPKPQQPSLSSASMNQRGPVPVVGGGASSQVPQQHQQQILAQLRQAVSNGFISPQLLNYQLPHNILVLLQQLLQLQTAHQSLLNNQQQLLQQARVSGNRSNPQLEQMSGIIINVNQKIANIQKQLQQAQTAFFSSQKLPPMSQPLSGTLTAPSGGNIIESLDALSTDLANVAIQSQSRLTTQWKPTADSSIAAPGDNNSAAGNHFMTSAMKTVDNNADGKSSSAGKGLFQSSSSPNLSLIQGGLGMTSDKTWSSNISATSVSNWPMSSENSNVTSSLNQTSANSLLSGLPSGLNDGIPEFVPGKPWQGLTKNVEDDPHITPGSIQYQRSLSVNRVHDESLNNLDGHKLVGGSWSSKPDSNLGLSHIGSRPPPNMTLSKAAVGQGLSSGGFNRQTSWPHSANSAFTKVPGSNNWTDSGVPMSSWILLKNLSVDPSTVRALSAQHGTQLGFYSLAQGQFALVQYISKEVAFVAQQRLNNFQMGASVISAEFLSDSDAQRLIPQVPPPQSLPSLNTSPWSQAPPSAPFPSAGVRSADPWSSSMPGAHFNNKFGAGGENLWGLWDRSDHTSNPLSNILGGESM